MNIAMIGAGNYARAHLEVLSREPGIEIVGHVSRTPQSREAAARQWGGRAYASCADLLQFDTGAKGVFTATCLLEGTEEVYLKLVCEGLLVTIHRDGVTFESGGERREVKGGEDLVAREDRAFLDAVRQNDPSELYSSYGDALLTHSLCFDVLEAGATGSAVGS